MAANGDHTKNEINEQDVLEEKAGAPNDDAGIELSPQHQEYLIQHHGTVDLDPVPSMDDADPYNWPVSKVLLLSLVVQRIGCDVLDF